MILNNCDTGLCLELSIGVQPIVAVTLLIANLSLAVLSLARAREKVRRRGERQHSDRQVAGEQGGGGLAEELEGQSAQPRYSFCQSYWSTLKARHPLLRALFSPPVRAIALPLTPTHRRHHDHHNHHSLSAPPLPLTTTRDNHSWPPITTMCDPSQSPHQFRPASASLAASIRLFLVMRCRTRRSVGLGMSSCSPLSST